LAAALLASPARAQFPLYVSESGANEVDKISSSGAITPFATGLSSPRGLALDAAGNLYVAD
jgi:hypothetical protein